MFLYSLGILSSSTISTDIGLLAMLNASEADYRKVTSAIRDADGAAADMADTMLDNLSGSITKLQSAWEGLKLKLGERLSPYTTGSKA